MPPSLEDACWQSWRKLAPRVRARMSDLVLPLRVVKDHSMSGGSSEGSVLS